MTPVRYAQIAALWALAEQGSNGSVEGFAWAISVERSESGAVVQIVARGSGCTMLINQGEWHHIVVGAVDAFFHSNAQLLAELISQDDKS